MHYFMRAFAVNWLRNGGDRLTLQRLPGHADLQLLKRYVKQTAADLKAEHSAHAPFDHIIHKWWQAGVTLTPDLRTWLIRSC